MILKLKYKKLTASAIVSSVFSILFLTSASAAENAFSENLSLPIVTAEEAHFSHWSIPETKQEFWDLSELKNAYVNTAPAFLDDGVSVGKLDDEGLDKTMILGLAKEITNKEHAEVDSLLIAHKGKMVFESY